MNIRNCLIIIMLTLWVSLPAQNQRKRSQGSGFKNGYFSGSYIYTPSFMKKINNHIKDLGLKEFEESYFGYGFELNGNFNPYFGIGLKYFRGGDISQRIVYEEHNIEDPDLPDELKLDRAVECNVSQWGLYISYKKFMAGKFEFFGSAGGSYGSAQIIISQDYGDQTFEEMFDSISPDSNLHSRFNSSVAFKTDIFTLETETGFRIYLSTRIAGGLSAAYTYGFLGDKGEINNGFESVKSIPDLDYSGFTYKATLYFGY